MLFARSYLSLTYCIVYRLPRVNDHVRLMKRDIVEVKRELFNPLQ